MTLDMSDRSSMVELPQDPDGYVSFNCPYCSERFALLPAEVATEDVFQLFCPLCGMQGERARFLSHDVQRVAEVRLKNMARDAVNEGMKRLERQLEGSKHVRMRRDKPLKHEPEPEPVVAQDLDVVNLACCGRSAKVPYVGDASTVYCPYCGGVA